MESKSVLEQEKEVENREQQTCNRRCSDAIKRIEISNRQLVLIEYDKMDSVFK